MKLLLTSAGVTNDLIHEELIRLAGVSESELQVAYICTASNPSQDGRERAEKVRQQLGISEDQIRSIDVALDAPDEWKWVLDQANVIYVGGGNTYYLLDEVRKSGLSEKLDRYLDSRLYVGESAGSILVTPSIDVAAIDEGDENISGVEDTRGLKLVDFEISPHTPEDVSLQANRDYAKTIAGSLYCYDDNTALSIDNGAVRFVGNGEHTVLNHG